MLVQPAARLLQWEPRHGRLRLQRPWNARHLLAHHSELAESQIHPRLHTNRQLALARNSPALPILPAPCLFAHPPQRSPTSPLQVQRPNKAHNPPPISAFALPLQKATSSPMNPFENLQFTMMPKLHASGMTAERHSTAYSRSSITCTTSTLAFTRASTCANGPAASAKENLRLLVLRCSAICEAIPEKSHSHVRGLNATRASRDQMH